MKFINRWSYSLARSLAEQLGSNHEKRHIYYYGFQMVVGEAFKFLVLVAFTLLTGIFLSTFAAILFYTALRVPAGGYHMGKFVRCMITTSLMFILSGVIVKFTNAYWTRSTLAILAAAVLVTALVSVMKWAPADTPYKPITKPEQKKTLKAFSMLVVIAWAAVEIAFIVGGHRFISLAGSLGILMAVFMISPAGYRFFGYVEHKGGKPEKAALHT